MIECKLCGKKLHFITGSHLRKHNISIKEYKQLFPDALTVDKELSQKFSEYCKNQNKNNNFGFKLGHTTNKNKEPWNKGKTKEIDNRIKSAKGRKHTIETRRKISQNKKQFYKDHPDKIPKGEKNGMYGKKISPEHLMKLLNANACNIQNKVEREAQKTLEQFGFEYVGDRKYWITFKDGTHKCPDFISESRKTVVEIYGDYWHKNDNPQDIIDKYKEVGWNCFVFWEHEIWKKDLDPDTFAQALGEWEMEEFTYEDFFRDWMY